MYVFFACNFQNTIFDNVTFEKFIIHSANFEGAHLYKTDFSNIESLRKEYFKNAWVWSDTEKDDLPKFPEKFGNVKNIIKFCDVGIDDLNRIKYYNEQKYGLPTHCK